VWVGIDLDAPYSRRHDDDDVDAQSPAIRRREAN
jgi:hypothetical protein